MDSMKIKLVLIGPAKVGKSRIANYLAEFEENPNFETYNPTVGVRILEFERDVKSKGGRVTKIQVEVWDASGDKKYENCWPSITKNASGVIMVYDPNIRTQERDIELWHKAFVQPLKLSDSQVLICAHQRDPVGKRNYLPSQKLERYPFAVSGLDNAEGLAALRKSFDQFLVGVVKAVAEKSKADMEEGMRSLA